MLETHGYFNEEFEQSTNARGQVTGVRVVGHNELGSVVEITSEKAVFTLMVSNQMNVTKDSQNQLEFDGKTYSWTGFYALETLPVKGEK